MKNLFALALRIFTFVALRLSFYWKKIPSIRHLSSIDLSQHIFWSVVPALSFSLKYLTRNICD